MKHKLSKRILSTLIAMVMLIGLLPTAAMAAIRDPIVEIPTTLSFKTEPQSGSALKTEGYAYTWALNKAADMIVLEIKETNRLTGASSWEQLATLTGTSGSGTLAYPVPENRRPNDQSEYRISAVVAGKTLEDSELASCTFIVTWMGLQTFTVTVKGGTGSGEYAPGASVTVTADQSGEGWQFLKWSGLEGLTITNGSATTETVTFTMPLQAVELTAVYQRIAQDSTPVRPAKGDGTEGNPFQITNLGELYWFAGFVNKTVTDPDLTVNPYEACAELMNDITVNDRLLTEDGALSGTSGLVEWIPIGLTAGYDGTFDGNGKTVSGIYCAPQDATKNFYGFFSHIDDGCVRNLTLADSYVCAPAKNTAYTGGITGQVYENGTVENCHFDGTVTTAITGDSENKENYTYLKIAGIAGNVLGEVRDCTVRGLISGYGRLVGGIAAYVNDGEVSGCVNEATVENTRSDTGYYYTGGIAAAIRQGTVRDCCNTGNVSSGWISAGIVCHVEDQGSTVSRCWNEGEIKNGSGIVCLLKGTVQNCYNTGKVECGIVGQANSGSSITYCHNVGEITSHGSPIWDVFSSDVEIADCYYMADSEMDEYDGTTYKTAAEFAGGLVLFLLNAGDNAGNWKQGGAYPILDAVFTLTVNGGTGSGTYGVGTEVTVTATVPDGMVFAGWEGLDGLIVEAGQAAKDSISTTFLMPKRDVELTAQFESIDPTRPAGSGTEDDPFQISTAGELYWFAGFVNGTIEKPADITVSIDEACAKVMNDITVNHDLLADDYTLNVSEENTDLLAGWEPIGPNGYMGTFDGNGKTISGIYCAPQAADDYRYGGFFRSLDAGRSASGDTARGHIRDLTLKDSYFCAPAKNSAYTGALVGYISSSCAVENCHFDGTVTTAITADSSDEDKETYQYVHIAGIAGFVAYGEIRDCTVRGLISGYGSEMGGVAAYVTNSEVTGCVNEATVENSYSGDTGGIVGRMVSDGIIRDCRNKGTVIGRSSAGIISNVESKGGEVIRCWNEGDIQGYYTAGIVAGLSGTVLNCYNAGSAAYAGIVGTPYPGCSITYCHNVGSITDGSAQSIIGYIRNSCTIENCYYLADSETDVLDGTTAKTAAQFADGTVLALLNNGHWTQGEDDEYPVLGDVPGVTISGMVTSFGEESEQTTVQLFPSGSDIPAFSVTLTGTHAMYSFKGVETGTYTMKVSKANHVTREYTVFVGNSPIPLDPKIHLKGDIDGNGKVNVGDTTKVYSHVKKTALITDEYMLLCADVSGDGRINVGDTTKVYAHVKKTSLLW